MVDNEFSIDQQDRGGKVSEFNKAGVKINDDSDFTFSEPVVFETEHDTAEAPPMTGG